MANRGSHVGEPCTLATFAVGVADGGLSLLAHTVVGRSPRHFCVDPTGRFMLCVALWDNAIDVYRLDGDGVPKRTEHSLDVPAPTHTLFVGADVASRLAEFGKL